MFPAIFAGISMPRDYPLYPHRLLPAFGLLKATQQRIHRDHVDTLASTAMDTKRGNWSMVNFWYN